MRLKRFAMFLHLISCAVLIFGGFVMLSADDKYWFAIGALCFIAGGREALLTLVRKRKP